MAKEFHSQESMLQYTLVFSNAGSLDSSYVSNLVLHLYLSFKMLKSNYRIFRQVPIKLLFKNRDYSFAYLERRLRKQLN